MRATNLEMVKQTYAAFARGDVAAVLEMFAPDASIGIVGRRQDAPFLGIHSGKDGVREFFKQLGEAHEIHTFEPVRFLAADDEVFVWGHYHWTMRNSGVSKDTEWFHVLTWQDGKVVKWRGHNDTAMLAEAYHGAPIVARSAAAGE
jgi:ketosteroid isomerase-like protein